MDSIDTGDTAWLLLSTALVMVMTPALGFFYGGLVGKKNVLSTLTHSFFILCLISVQWVLWGYSLAFSPDTGAGLIGGLGWVALKGVGFAPNPDYAATGPHPAFMAFQMMFAVITPALIPGAMAGLTWLTASWLHKGRPSVLGMAAGAVAGLVAITPASGFVDVSGSIIIGLGAGVVCYGAMQLRPRLKIDDALDVWAVHGIGGTRGARATRPFPTVPVNS